MARPLAEPRSAHAVRGVGPGVADDGGAPQPEDQGRLRSILRSRVLPRFAGTRIAAIEGLVVRRFVAALAEAGMRPERSATPSTSSVSSSSRRSSRGPPQSHDGATRALVDRGHPRSVRPSLPEPGGHLDPRARGDVPGIAARPVMTAAPSGSRSSPTSGTRRGPTMPRSSSERGRSPLRSSSSTCDANRSATATGGARWWPSASMRP